MQSNYKGYGLIQIYYGEGKGKTTAALGQSIRCAGAGKRVAIIFFDKGGDSHYSERKILDQILNIDYFVTGRDRIDSETGKFDFSIQEIDKQEAERGLELARIALTSGKYDLVVLDEINSTTHLGMLSVEDMLDVIEEKNQNVELIMTGRNPNKKFKEKAHLISEIKPKSHYFYSGIDAREGLDF